MDAPKDGWSASSSSGACCKEVNEEALSMMFAANGVCATACQDCLPFFQALASCKCCICSHLQHASQQRHAEAAVRAVGLAPEAGVLCITDVRNT